MLPRLAREAITAHLAGRRYRAPLDLDELRQVRGAFVTLRRRADGELRGCIGVVEPSRPLAETVAEMALDAIRGGRLYVITHDEGLEPLRRRLQRMEQAILERQP